jgi:hypothetical protein
LLGWIVNPSHAIPANSSTTISLVPTTTSYDWNMRVWCWRGLGVPVLYPYSVETPHNQIDVDPPQKHTTETYPQSISPKKFDTFSIPS